AGGRKWLRSLRAGTSYLAGNPPELHFGLGKVTGPAVVTVDWPSGRRSTHQVAELSRWIVLEEPGA
ncbi:MAG: ASPIC/UnbV domain-containing protein, partial [Planctomycetota bacterium]